MLRAHVSVSPGRAPLRCLMAAVMLALAAGCAQQARPPVPPPAGIVSVSYADPGAFTEARRSPPESPKARNAWVSALCLHLSERAAAVLPEGQTLEVHITDVQRAGSFEPGRGSQASNVRIVRDIYPPRIDLTFKLLGKDGAVLREGSRQLRDSTFMMRADRYPNDPLRYEKTLLDDWVQREWSGAKAG